LLVQE